MQSGIEQFVEADDKQFAAIALNPFHLLHHASLTVHPSRRDTHYSLIAI